MSHERQLVGAVEGDQFLPLPARAEGVGQASVGEDPLDEVLPQRSVVEPTFLLDRQVGEVPRQLGGEQALALGSRRARRAVDPDPFHPARRRRSLEHVAGQLGAGQFGDALTGEADHGVGMVIARFRADQPDVVSFGAQAKARSWCSETQFDFGAYGHPFDEGSEPLGQEPVPLVAAVEPDLLAQETRRDPDFDRPVGCPECHFVKPMSS